MLPIWLQTAELIFCCIFIRRHEFRIKRRLNYIQKRTRNDVNVETEAISTVAKVGVWSCIVTIYRYLLIIEGYKRYFSCFSQDTSYAMISLLFLTLIPNNPLPPSNKYSFRYRNIYKISSISHSIKRIVETRY